MCSTETACLTPPRGRLSAGTLSAKDGGAEIDDHVERPWSDPYPESDLELSDLSDLVSNLDPVFSDVARNSWYRIVGKAKTEGVLSRVSTTQSLCGIYVLRSIYVRCMLLR